MPCNKAGSHQTKSVKKLNDKNKFGGANCLHHILESLHSPRKTHPKCKLSQSIAATALIRSSALSGQDLLIKFYLSLSLSLSPLRSKFLHLPHSRGTCSLSQLTDPCAEACVLHLKIDTMHHHMKLCSHHRLHFPAPSHLSRAQTCSHPRRLAFQPRSRSLEPGGRRWKGQVMTTYSSKKKKKRSWDVLGRYFHWAWQHDISLLHTGRLLSEIVWVSSVASHRRSLGHWAVKRLLDMAMSLC